MNNAKLATLYIVRHGESEWNIKHLIQGQKDIVLSKNGKLQAQILAGELKKISFEFIFSSDLLRAKRTAEIVALEHKLAVQTAKVLRERSFGKLEGQPTSLLREYEKKLLALSAV